MKKNAIRHPYGLKKDVYALLKKRLLLFLMTVLFTGAAYTQVLPNNDLEKKTMAIGFSNSTLDNALATFEKTSGFRLIYPSEPVEKARMVTLTKEERTIAATLQLILQGSNLDFRQSGNTIVLFTKNEKPQNATVPQNLVVRGTVVDENELPLPGTVVSVKGNTKKNATTNNAGEFELSDVAPNAVLLLSFMGYEELEYAINGHATIKVNLKPKTVQLDEVVVTGYQTISRERSAGSFVSVQGNKVSERVALSGSILESLDGLSTGLNINYGEGENKMTLRGITSFMSNTAPLFVVDNVPISADNVETMINENDIDKITVLKDATATSIWGSQAANGVIIITTKRGYNTDKKLKISYDGSFNYTGYPDYSYNDYMSSSMFIKNAQEIFSPSVYTWTGVTTQTTGMVGSYTPIVFPHEYPMYMALDGTITEDLRDEQLKKLASQNNRSQVEEFLMSPRFFTRQSLSFTGGSESYSFYGSLAYEFNQDNGRNKYNKYSINMRQDFKLTKWMSFELTTNISAIDNNYSIQPSNTNLNTLLPYKMLRDADGNNLSHADLLMYEPARKGYETASGLNLNYVPLDEINLGFNTNNAFNARLNAGLIINLFEGLKYEGRFSYQRNNAKTRRFYDQKSYPTRLELGMFTTPGTTPTYNLPANGGKYMEGNNYENDWTIRNQLNFDREFGNSYITAIAGMEIQDSRLTGTRSNVYGYDPQTLLFTPINEENLFGTGVAGVVPGPSTNNTLSDKSFYSSEVEKRFVSFYANGAYTFQSKYSINGSVRVDQSNLFGSDPSVQFKPVWSAGLIWNIQKETFMENAHWLDRFNLRASYGYGGNSPDPGVGGAYNILMAGNNSNFSGLGTGYTILYPANKKLTWERTRTVNVGLDFALINTVLSGSIDVYDKFTTGMLSESALNPVSGWFSGLANVGEMSNKGFECSLTSRNIRTSAFEWSTTAVVSYNKNKIESLYIDEPITVSTVVGQTYREGYAARSIFAYSWAGLDEQYGDPQVYNSDGTKVKRRQDLTDISVAKYMGTSQPPWFGSLTNVLRFNNVEFSFMFVYNLGHKMRNDVNTFYTNRLISNIHQDFDQRWREPGDELTTNVPSYEPIAGTSDSRRTLNLYRYADINVLSASYVKLRDVSLYYSLPRRVCDILWADAVKIKLQASNLFYIAANKEGIDPEAFNYGAGWRGTKFGPSFSVGLSVNFK